MSIAGEIILKSLGAWVAIWGFSRLLNAPKKLECYTAGVGMIGCRQMVHGDGQRKSE